MGAGVIPDELIREIAEVIPPGVSSFLLTSQCDADAIIQQQRYTRVNTVQLVDRVQRGDLVKLRETLPGVSLVQVVHVTGPDAVSEAAQVAPVIDAILLDSGDPSLAVKELGGTGRTHNGELSARVVQAVPRPVFLVGGLQPDNVREAIRAVRPYGVDVCSGLWPHGRLDEGLLRAFLSAVHGSAAARKGAAADAAHGASIDPW